MYIVLNSRTNKRVKLFGKYETKKRASEAIRRYWKRAEENNELINYNLYPLNENYL